MSEMEKNTRQASNIQSAFIAGGGAGIGRALALQLLEEGVVVYATDIREKSLKALRADAKAFDGSLHTALLDVADRSQFYGVSRDAIDVLGGVDAVFNNACVSLVSPADGSDDSDDQWLFDINFWGVVTGTKLFLPHMKARNKGHIINMSSIFGFMGIPGQSMYCAAKHAVQGFTESLLHEVYDTGVSVHCVQPGFVDPDMGQGGYYSNKNQSHFEDDPESVGGGVDGPRTFYSWLSNISPEEAAAEILTGVRRQKYHILVGTDARRHHFMRRLFPSMWRWMMLNRTVRHFERPGIKGEISPQTGKSEP